MWNLDKSHMHYAKKICCILHDFIYKMSEKGKTIETEDKSVVYEN